MKTYETITGIDELISMKGSAYPNPVIDFVTVKVEGNGDATLKVTDVAGKVAINRAVTLVEGSVKVDLSGLESGIYIFNVSLQNGQTSQFNVVKK